MYYQTTNIFYQETLATTKGYVNLVSNQLFQILKQGEFRLEKVARDTTGESGSGSYFRRISLRGPESPTAWHNLTERQQKMLKNGETVLSEPYPAGEHLTVALLVNNNHGEIVVGEFEPKILWQGIRGSFYGKDDTILVLAGRRILARSSQGITDKKIDNKLISRMAGDGVAFGEFEFDDGENVHWVSKSLWLAGRYGAHRWHILALRPKEAVRAPAKLLLRSLLFFLGIVTLIIVYISVRVGRRIFLPVKELSESIKSMADGFWFSPVEYRNGTDELGELVNNFNRMGRSLKTETAYMNKIMEKMKETVLVIGRDTTVRRGNRVLLDLLNYSREEIIDQSASMLFEEGSNPDFPLRAQNIESLVESREEVNLHYRSKTGEQFKVRFKHDFIRNGAGEIVSIILVGLVPSLLENEPS
jgi:PAS domain S-box-containing protein